MDADQPGGARVLRVAALHSRLTEAEKTLVLTRFQSGRDVGSFDIVVTVNSLGEGYDFAYLSVVGVLRNFRSLAPFYQFCGRAVRRITTSIMGTVASFNVTRLDNVAHIITHQVGEQRASMPRAPLEVSMQACCCVKLRLLAMCLSLPLQRLMQRPWFEQLCYKMRSNVQEEGLDDDGVAAELEAQFMQQQQVCAEP